MLLKTMLPLSTLAFAVGSVVASLILIPNSKPEINIFEIENYVDSNTVCLVGSVPSYPHGIIDPIEDMSNFAFIKNLCLVAKFHSEKVQTVPFLPPDGTFLVLIHGHQRLRGCEFQSCSRSSSLID